MQVVSHFGQRPDTGHYTTTVKLRKPGTSNAPVQWREYNDSTSRDGNTEADDRQRNNPPGGERLVVAGVLKCAAQRCTRRLVSAHWAHDTLSAGNVAS